MKRVLLIKAMLVLATILVDSCCPVKFDMKDIEFTNEDLELLSNYQIGDTIYFESNLGDLDTITIIDFVIERHEGGNDCIFPTAGPYQRKEIIMKHLPKDNFTGTSQNEGEERRITYQYLISVGRSPIDTANMVGYAVQYRGFVSSDFDFWKYPNQFLINNVTIDNCFKVTHGYAERVVNPNDIEVVYWTAKYGLTAYSSKSGETWLITSLK